MLILVISVLILIIAIYFIRNINRNSNSSTTSVSNYTQNSINNKSNKSSVSREESRFSSKTKGYKSFEIVGTYFCNLPEDYKFKGIGTAECEYYNSHDKYAVLIRDDKGTKIGYCPRESVKLFNWIKDNGKKVNVLIKLSGNFDDYNKRFNWNGFFNIPINCTEEEIYIESNIFLYGKRWLNKYNKEKTN